MSKQANTKLIGGFVVGAIALIIGGVLLFGSGELLGTKMEYVLFFDDSVKGLNIGAPVDFKGVKVGTVTDIKIVLDDKNLSLRIPVFVQIDPEQISFANTETELERMVEQRGTKTLVSLLINEGLKAQLVMQSLVTGQLGIHLDFHPDKPIRLTGDEPDYTEIPTLESSLSALSKTLENVPVAEIAQKVVKTLDGLEKLVNSPDLSDMIVSLNQAVKDVRTLLQNLDSQVQPLAASAQLSLAEAQKMFGDASQLARNLDTRLPQLLAVLEDASKSAGTTMKGVNKAVDGLTGQNSAVRAELIKALNEFSTAARSFRVLAQYLESHPEALLRGKGK